jgi:hypothetical protein
MTSAIVHQDNAYLLAEQISVKQLPIVISKLQMAYDLLPHFILKDKRLLTINWIDFLD